MRLITALLGILLLPQILIAQGGLTGVIPTDPSVNRTNWAHNVYGTTIGGASNSGILIDGIRNGVGSIITTSVSAGGALTIDLGAVRTLSRAQLRLWDGDNRYYRYKLESSQDNVTYEMLVDRTTGEHQSVQHVEFAPVAVRYVKITGTFVSTGNDFRLVDEVILSGESNVTPHAEEVLSINPVANFSEASGVQRTLHAGIYEVSYESGAASKYANDSANGGKTWSVELTAKAKLFGHQYDFGLPASKLANFATAAQAGAYGQSKKFTVYLPYESAVSFYYPDSGPGDNRGGVQYRLKQLSGPNDSLLARVRDALTRSTLWEERAVAGWESWLNTTNRYCYGCHTQTQASVGLNDSKQKLPDLPISVELEGELVDAYQTWQNPVGWVSPFHNSYYVTQTSLWAWAVATYKGSSSQQLTSHLVDAMNWLVSQQQANGGWNADHSDGNGAKLYFDGIPSASHTSGNITALVSLMDRLSTGFTPFSAVSISGGQVDFQVNPGNRIDLQVAPVQNVTAIRVTVNESFDSTGNFVLNEVDLYNGATRHTINSATASFEQTGFPIAESFNGVRTNINDGWAVSPQVVTTTPAVGEWRLGASDIDRVSITQIYPNLQLKRYRLEYTTDPTPSATAVYLPFSITQVGVAQGITTYQTALSNAAGLFMSSTWNYARNVRTAAQSIIGLYAALPYLSGAAATQAVSTLQAIGVQLRAAQRADGGWSDAMNGTGSSAPYYSAMALKALSLIADSTLDDALRRGADFLLETQNALGYWSQSNFGTALAPTTWVEIALPAIFDVLNQQYQRDVITDLTAEGFVGENRLYWSPITGATGYDVYRKVEGGPFELVASGYVNGIVTYLDTNVTNEVTYYYMVKWLDNEGRESAESNEASATPYGLQCGADTPPVIRSGPPVSAVPDEVYVYQVDASDADPNDNLSFSLTAAPSGMVINQSSGQITWTPTQQQVGSHFVKVRVSDRIGRFATQAYRINVSEVYFNREPAFYSTPLETAYQGNPYQYVARASDPNVGDMLTYALMEKPAGASINPTTGRITWSPAAGQMGSPQFFRVRVTDTGGLFDEQTFNVSVQGNTAPIITSTPDVAVYTGQVYYYEVEATDAEGGPLLYSLVQAPIGMFINPSTGAVIWTSGGVGAALVTVRVSDPANAVAEQPFSIDVIDNLAPIITSVPPGQGVVGAPYQYLISATDPEADPISYALVSGPAGMTISGRTVSYVPLAGQEGMQSVRVSASDAGQTTEQDFTIQVLAAGSIIPPGPGGVGGSPDLPQVTLNSPDTLQPIETLTPVVITITDPLPGGAPLTWEVELAREGGGAPIVIGSGSGVVTQQEVGVIDPSVLESDPYRITVRVTKGATTVSPWWGINVISRLKFGEFIIGATDFSIPLSGVSIDIRRQYRSFDLLNYDFGFGWRLGTAGRVVDSAPESPMTPYGSNTKVYVTKPDGKRVGFRFQAVGVPLFGFKLPSFVPDPGVTDTLETEQIPIIVTPNGFYEMFGGEYNPSRFVLTTKERVRYTIDEQQGLLEVRDANSNRLEFSAGGISHSGGISVSFTRDSAGRITRVTDGAGGHYDYLYNLNGELQRVTKPSGEHTDFTYDSGHRLLTITDNAGIVVLRNEYDSAGRLIRQFDANNNVVQISSDPATRTESITDRNGGVTQFTYDEDGNVTQMVDALGGVTSYSYDANFNQTSVTNPLGQTTTRVFDGASNLLSETDPLGHTTTHTYNSLGQKLSTTNPLGLTETKTYNTFGNLLSETGFDGATVQYTYSSGGDIQTSRDELGNITGYVTANGKITAATDAQGKVTNLFYDSRGNPLGWSRTRTVNGVPQTITVSSTFDDDNRMISSTDAEGGLTLVAYNSRGLRSAITNRRGVVKTFEYDAEGRETKIIYHDLTEERTSYDPEGRVLSRRDRNGRETTYQYDLLGRQTRVTYADGAFETTQYDAAGRVRFETDARGFVTEHRYDAAGRKVKTIDPLSHETTYEYDATGRLTAEIDANGHRTEYEYDGEGRQIRVVYPGGAIEITNYDAAGRKREQIDANGNATRWDYDSLGRLTAVTNALSNVTSYGYDEIGNRVSQTDARGKLTRFEFDKLGRETKRITPLGNVWRSSYDAEGNLVTRIDPANRTTSYVYNNDNRLVTITYPNSTTVSFTHLPGGERQSVVDSRGTTSYTYDLRNRLKTMNEPGAVIQYEYDLAGNKSKVETTAGVTNYTYDALNRIATVADSIIGLTSYSYDPVGNELSVTYPNGFVTEKVYDVRNRVTRVATKQGGSVVVQSFDYVMDNVGNRLTITNEAGEVSAYTYDAAYKLLSESETPASGPASLISYTYDAVGNRLTKNDNGAVTAYAYDDDDRMLSAGSTAYLYDVNGNTTSVNPGSGVVQYGWDYDDRLVSVTKPGVSASYVYNPDNIRVGATVNGAATQYVVDSNMDYASVLEERSVASVNSRYVYGDDLLSQTNGSSTDFLHYDALGSTRALSNASGVSGRYDYRAFGEVESHSGATSKYLFTGEQYDSASESYYLRARYYNPTAGRFLSGDKYSFPLSYTSELNRYAYTAGNPVNAVDPSGLATAIGYQQVSQIGLGSIAGVTATAAAVTCQLYITATSFEFISFIFGSYAVPLPNVPWFCKAHQVRAQLQKSGRGRYEEGSAVALNHPDRGVTVLQMYGLLQPFVPGSRALSEFPSRSLETWLVGALNRARKAVWGVFKGGGINEENKNFFRDESPWFRGTQWRLDLENMRGWNLRNRA